MLITILILSIINLLGLTTAGLIFFKRNYVIVGMEEWNTVAGVFNAAVAAGQIDENDAFIPAKEIPVDELPGGYGDFFRDALYEEEDEPEEE